MAGCLKTCALAGALFVLWLGVGVGPTRPQAVEDSLSRIGLFGEAQQVARRLAGVQKLVDQKQWSEAIEEYQQIIDEAGDELVPVNSRNCVRARWVCHVRLAALLHDVTARRIYRERVDDQARKWLEQGAANRDARMLRRLVDDAFCSRHTDRALDLLGDLAFEQGRFEDAERWWRLLALPALETTARQQAKVDPQQAALLLYPDPQIDLAAVRAKLILVRLFRGERASLAPELKAFRAMHPKAEGRLAGRTGPYADILERLLARPADWSPMPVRELSWPTFAGASSRSFVATAGPRLMAFDSPPRIVPLLDGDEEPDAAEASPPSPARLPVVHPVIVGEQVFIASAVSVDAYELRTGRRTGRCSLLDDLKLPLPDGKGKAPGAQERRSTLTVADGFVYARLGNPMRTGTPDGGANSYLVCLNARPDRVGRLVPRWPPVQSRRQAPEVPALFEGAPVVRDGGIYIARSRLGPGTVITGIDCYDAETAAPRWQQDVCETPLRRDTTGRQCHHLLTLAGPNVVYCSHTGAVVALDAATGRRLWAVRYPSRGDRTADGGISPRDLAPCVARDGRLFVAPADLDRILCLDAASGQILWESKRVEVVHLLGVARGRLIFTIGSYPAGIRALDAATGADLRQWVQPDDGNALPSFGRGLLAGDHVFWPTVNGLRILSQQDGEVAAIDPTRLANIRRGNLAFGSGCLVVATARELAIYCPAGRDLEQRRQEATARPQQAVARYRLAVAEADAALAQTALADFARAEQLARPDERMGQMSLRHLAQMQRHELLLELAEQARAEQRTREARGFLWQAAAAEFPISARLHALGRLGGASYLTQPGDRVEVGRTILHDPALRQAIIFDRDGSPQQAEVWAVQQVRQGLQQDDAARKRYGAEADRAFDSTKRKGLESLEHFVREFSPASITATALLEIARLHEPAGRFGAAAQAYRASLRAGAKIPERVLALAGLARAYERQDCWEAARSTWQALVAEAGEQIVPGVDSHHPIRDFVSQQLQQGEYQTAQEAASRDVTLPVTHAWQATLRPADASDGVVERLLVPDARPTTVDGGDVLFFVRGRHLTCRDGATSKVRWARTLAVPANWIGRHADLVLTAADEGIDVRRLADGERVWQFAGVADMAPLSGFQLAGSRLFCLRLDRQLLALDAESGEVLWSRWAPGARIEPLQPGGRFFPLYHAGKERVVIQTAGGQRWILHSATGQLAYAAPTSRSPWPCPPVALDERCICLVPDAHHVVGLDPRTNKELWSHRIERWPSLSGEPPQMLADRDTVVLLVARNYGYELECLDARTGARRWPRAPLIDVQRFDLSCGALSADTVCLVHGGAVHARALTDGKPVWERPLEGQHTPWQVTGGRSCWIVYPRESQANPPGMSSRWTYHVLLCDRKDGQLIQCLNFAADAPHAAVAISQKRLTISLGENAWGLVGASGW